MPRDPFFWQQHINLAALLPIVKLTTDLFLTKEFFTWQNLGLICASSLLLKISSSISLTSKVVYFKRELLTAGAVGINENLQAYKEKCAALSREYNRLIKRQKAPYLGAVLQKMIQLLNAKYSDMAEHLGSLRKISLTNKERDERIIEGDKPDLNDPKTIWTAEERLRIKVARTNRKAESEGQRPPTRKERFLQFSTTAMDILIRFAEHLPGVNLPKVFKSNPPIYTGKERGSWRKIEGQLVDKMDESTPLETGNLKGFSYGVATHAGHKNKTWLGNDKNEDRWIAESFVVRGSKKSKKDYLVRVFGVADGHSGEFASDCTWINFSRYFKEHIESLDKEQISQLDIYNALIKTFASLNNFFYELNRKGGTTLTVSVIIDGMLYTAWVGDSRAILIKNQDNQATRLVPLSKDHKPRNQEASVNARGGIVVKDGGIRVGYMHTDPESNKTKPIGCLLPARVLGDCYMKRRISSRPSITIRPLSTIPEGSLIVYGTDGVFDNGSSRGYSDGLYQCRSNSLMDLAYQIVGSAVLAQWAGLEKQHVDNTTALVVRVPKFGKTVSASATEVKNS